jgi:hypothetical protein
MVGTARFELAAYGTQNRRATRLRYAPTEGSIRAVFGDENPYFAPQGAFV